MKQSTNPLKAIRLRCMDCAGEQANEVRDCPCVKCALYPFRMGKNPFRKKRTMTDAQKQAIATRLKLAREKNDEQ